jgi:flagellar hook-associated protein 3 FlgL
VEAAMISNLDPSTERFLADLDRLGARFQRAQSQISSGRRLTTASDDPAQVTDLLVVRSSFEQNTQIQTNLARAKTEVDTAEQSLQTAVKFLDRVIQLGAQGASSFQSTTQRAQIATEVDSLHEQLVSITATRVDGRYIFSGDADQQAPYSLDPTTAGGVGNYLGFPATRTTLHPTGSPFAIAKTAQDIFDDPNPANNVFLAVKQLELALATPPAVGGAQAQTDAITAALTNVRTAQDHLNGSLSFYGAVQNRIQSAQDLASNLQVSKTQELSGIEDADITSAILEMNQAQLQQQAALSSRAKANKSSLFDYLG